MLKLINNDQNNTDSGSGQLTASHRWALAGLSLSMLMPSLDTSIINAGLPTLELAFNASFQQVQWVVLAYLLPITTLIVSVGRLGDIVGRRRLLLVGIGIFTVASLLCGLSPTLPLLVISRVMQGLGASVMMVLAVALASETAQKGKAGTAMGLLGTMSAIGTTLGPSLGGVLISWLGWRYIFLVNLPLGIINLLMAHRYLPVDVPRSAAHRLGFDKIGTLLLGATLAAYSIAMTIGNGSFGILNVLLLGIAAVGVLLFIWLQRRVVSPLISLEIFRSPGLRAGLAMSTLVSTVVMATLVVGPFYLSKGLGLEAAFVGLAMTAGPLVAALVGLPAGQLVDRFGSPRLTIIGLIGIASGSILLSLVPQTFGVAGYVGPITVITASYAIFQAANNTAIIANANVSQRGVISGMLSLSRNLGLMTGASLMGTVFAISSGTNDGLTTGSAAIRAGMRTTFAIAAGIIVAAIAIAVSRTVATRNSTVQASRSSSVELAVRNG